MSPPNTTIFHLMLPKNHIRGNKKKPITMPISKDRQRKRTLNKPQLPWEVSYSQWERKVGSGEVTTQN